MKSLRFFIVDIPKVSRDTFMMGDKEYYLDSKYNEFEHRAMEGIVHSAPIKYNTGVEKGDTLYFHHHVTLGGNHLTLPENKNKLEAVERRGQYVHGYKDLYYVMYDGGYDPFFCQAYAYKSKKTGEIKLLGEWIFLTPAEQEEELKSDIIQLLPQKKPDSNQYGYVRWGSEKLKELGLYVGDKVYIKKNMDYVMYINGEKLFRTYLNHIYAKVETEV